MMEEDRRPEIIVVRRVAGGEEGHHGGAWKIAFADFMTAMMALFLVLWLVNAANEKTKKAVASYFNPVKLIDRKKTNRGLAEDSGNKTPTVDEANPSSAQKNPNEEQGESATPIKDREFFEDPFVVMDGLAQQEQAKIEDSETSLVQTNLQTATNEDAFHDPFAETFTPTPIVDSANKTEGEAVPDKAKSVLPEAEEQPENLKTNPKFKETEVEELLDPADKKTAEKLKQDRSKILEEMAEQIHREIKVKLKEKFGQEEQISDSLTVVATPEGILISITDQLDFSMFQVGSAVPKGAIILAMEEISSVLKIRQGKVRVYGHTDARPYSGKGYDNWRLSTARSHAARLMLIRGGLKGQRIAQVVGFADRRLRIPDIPQADANRRIEILLEVS